MTEINKITVLQNQLSNAMTFSAGTAEMTVEGGKDERTVLLIQNGDTVSAGICVMAGDGLRSAIGNLLCTVPAGEMRALSLESMRFKQMTGANKSKFCLKLCAPDHPETAFAGTAAKITFLQLRM